MSAPLEKVDEMYLKLQGIRERACRLQQLGECVEEAIRRGVLESDPQ